MSLEPRVVALEVNQKHIINGIDEIKSDQKMINHTMTQHMRKEEEDRMSLERKLEKHKWLYLGGVGGIGLLIAILEFLKTVS